MGVQTFDSNGGYAKFGKEANIYAQLKEMTPGWNDKQDRPQLEGTARGVSIEGDQRGTVPYYFNSKITILEDDQYSSNVGILLRDTGILEDVLREIGVDEEDIEEIADPSTNKLWSAEKDAENEALYEAILKHLNEAPIWKTSTAYSGNKEYSKIKKVIEQVDKDPFADDESEGDAESESDTESESDSDSEGAVIA